MFPGKRERIYTIWILTVCFSSLILAIIFIKFEADLLNLFESTYWGWVFVIPFFSRIFMIFKFPEAERVQISESERNIDEHRGLYITLSGFSFSALFALVLATTSSTANIELLGLSILLMLVSFIMFYGAFTFEGFKYYRWQVDIIEAISDTGKISLLLSLLVAIFSTKIDSNIKLISLVFFTIFWLASFLKQFTARYSYLNSFE